jgi:RNA polymerase sigma-70 factor (ECF subfamily)
MVQDCLETVPRAQRIAFYLREVEEMQTKEICKKMAVSGTNLGVMLFRARNRLRECLEKKGLKKG